MSFRLKHACTLGLLSTLAGVGHAGQIDYTVGIGVEHNDNLNLGETDPVADTIIEPTFAFNGTQSGSTIQAAANGIVRYRDFTQGNFSNDFLGQLTGQLNWSAIPERLDIGIEDYLGVQPINNLQPDTPGNQQQTNVIAIGPTLKFGFGPTVRGQAELRFINSYADETEQFNSNRVSAALRAIKDLSASSTIAGNIVDERVTFRDSTVGPDYNRYSAFGRHTRQWAKFNLTADFGYTWLKYSGSALGADDRDAPLARANLDWHFSDRSTLTVDVAHQLSDAASSLLAGTAIGPGTVNPIPVQISTGSATSTSAAFLENRIDLGYGYRGLRLAFTVAPYYRKLDYGFLDNIGDLGDGAAINQSARGATLTASWLLRPLVTIGVVASGENVRYDALDREDKTRTVQAFLSQQFTRHWSWRADLTRYERDSSVVGQSANQNIVFVGLTYAR